MNISILGAGTWGVALSKVLSNKHQVIVWSPLAKEVDSLSTTRKHPNLPGMDIPSSIEFTNSLEDSIKEAEVLIIATPSIFVRSTCEKIKPLINKNQIIASVAKGIEEGTLFTMSEIIEDVVGKDNPVVALSGPTHAEEVALDIPTLIVSASSNLKAAETVQNLFTGTCIRPYTNDDIKGVELCGALKNIIALGCGISTGLGFGDNTKAAIITRGLSEITKLGRIMGCKEETFAGLAGVGDLIVTATSEHSRNNRAGFYIGQGMSAKEAKEKVGMVVEGINALPAAIELTKKYDIEMPVISIVNDIINGHISAKDSVIKLFERKTKAEHYKI